MKKYKDNIQLLNNIESLNNEGYLDSQISVLLDIDRRTVCYLRKKYLLAKCIRNNTYLHTSNDFKEKLKKCDYELVSEEIIQINEKHKGYRVRCIHCKEERIKATYTIGKQKCQCTKSHKPVYNFNGYELISATYFESCRKGAEVRSLPFEITIEDIWNQWVIQEGKCQLSGITLTIERNYRRRKNMTASLDRIDSLKGYTLDNIQWVHKDLNRMKMNYPNGYFIEMCKLVSNNNK